MYGFALLCIALCGYSWLYRYGCVCVSNFSYINDKGDMKWFDKLIKKTNRLQYKMPLS